MHMRLMRGRLMPKRAAHERLKHSRTDKQVFFPRAIKYIIENRGKTKMPDKVNEE